MSDSLKVFVRLGAVLTGAAMSAALVVPAAASPVANADVGIQSVTCTGSMPYLNSGYGPLKMCYNLAASPAGTQGQAGLYSPITGGFNPLTGWLRLRANSYRDLNNITADDGHVEDIRLGPELDTAYGPASWGVQYWDNSRVSARFGSYNYITRRFYPISGWLTVGWP